jgi:hypothetical protein
MWGEAETLFRWAQPKNQTVAKQAPDTVGDLFDVSELLAAIDAVVPRYLNRVDQGALVYPACKRMLTDRESDPRSIWAHTRLEAVRYMTMVPGRQVGLLVEPARQAEIFDTFLRKQPHEKTVVDFTGIAADDLVTAIIAGLNWLNHCALLAGVDHNRFSGTQRNFRRMSALARQWWALQGAEARCTQMRETREKPPFMLHLVWQNYTVLAKEIAAATMFGPSIEKTVTRRQKMLDEELRERPGELAAAIGELQDAVFRFETAREPDDLLGITIRPNSPG